MRYFRPASVSAMSVDRASVAEGVLTMSFSGLASMRCSMVEAVGVLTLRRAASSPTGSGIPASWSTIRSANLPSVTPVHLVRSEKTMLRRSRSTICSKNDISMQDTFSQLGSVFRLRRMTRRMSSCEGGCAYCSSMDNSSVFLTYQNQNSFMGFMLEASLCWTPMDFGTWFVGETIIAKVQANFYSTTFSS